MGPKELLSVEQKLAPPAASITAACAATGLSTYLVDQHSTWLQWSALAHILTGLGCLLTLLPYVFIHFRRTLSIRRLSVLLSGIVTVPPLLGMAGAGLFMFLDGQREAARWIYWLHVYAAFALLSLVALHFCLHLWLRGKRKATAPIEATSYAPGILRKVVVLTGAVQLVIVGCTLAYNATSAQYSTASAAPNYSYSYGEHRFRPSQTETANGAFVDKRQIAESKRCISCHRDVADQWNASAHRQSASDAAYVTNVTLLATKKGIAATRYCEGCHAPVALLSGELSPGGEHAGIVGTVANVEGVSCMGCHGIDKMIHLKGVASYEFDARQDYLFETSENPLLRRLHDLLLRSRPAQHRADLGKPLFKDPQYCAACHAQFMDKDMNSWGWVKMQDEYTAWVNSPYSKQQEEAYAENSANRCQDCHMPLVPSSDPSRDEEGRVRSHAFLGANTFLPMLNGDEAHLAQTKEFLQTNKLRVSIDRPKRTDTRQNYQALNETLRSEEEAPPYYYLGEKAALRVAVTNRGVGHDFPGGTIDIGEAWVEFQVHDADGVEVFSSGSIRSSGDVDPSAYFYRSLAVDKKGEHVWRHDLFNMVGESFRRVIKSGETDVAEFAFAIPSWAKSPLTVAAALKYRKLNDRYARWALAKQYVAIPAVNLAWDSLQLPLKLRREVD